MKSKNQRRVINIPKEQFDTIKSHCDELTLDMPKWIVKNSLEKIPNINKEDDFLSLLEDDPAIKFKTYDNVNPEFRFTKEFICNVLFPRTDLDSWKIVKDKKHNRFIIKNKMVRINNTCKDFGYRGVGDECFVSIQNAYKDVCDSIEWGIQENVEDGAIWFVYILNTKLKSYYED
jgi:hypothetical protein